MRIIAALIMVLLLQGASVRDFLDKIGFSTRPHQIEAVVKASEAAEKELLEWEKLLFAGKSFVAAIAPHDDHLYAGRVYIHALPKIADASTVVIFGVTHSRVRKALSDPRGIVIFDEFSAWAAPYSPVKVDDGLRKCLMGKLSRNYYMVSNKAHSLEHSIEAMVPFLQYYNRKVRILPVMVTGMKFERMKKVALSFARGLRQCLKEEGRRLGKDVKVLISTDTTHYGPDFNYQPYGVGEDAHRKAVMKDINLGRELLSGVLTEEKVGEFYKEVVGGGITWCGRYTVSFALLTLEKFAEMEGKVVKGYPLRYGDSYTLGVLPLKGLGIGLTAPFSLSHWVGYWAIGYVW